MCNSPIELTVQCLPYVTMHKDRGPGRQKSRIPNTSGTSPTTGTPETICSNSKDSSNNRDGRNSMSATVATPPIAETSATIGTPETVFAREITDGTNCRYSYAGKRAKMYKNVANSYKLAINLVISQP